MLLGITAGIFIVCLLGVLFTGWRTEKMAYFYFVRRRVE